jgi:hypothetical protein
MAPEKFDLHSVDIAQDKQRELLRLFPEIRTEGGKIDFERLKMALGDAVVVGRDPGDCRPQARAGSPPGRGLYRQRPTQGQRRANLHDQGRHQLQDGVAHAESRRRGKREKEGGKNENEKREFWDFSGSRSLIMGGMSFLRHGRANE